MKGWIKFGPKEVVQPRGGEWHKAIDVVVRTACARVVVTDERPGADFPGYGAKVCPTCLATRDE